MDMSITERCQARSSAGHSRFCRMCRAMTSRSCSVSSFPMPHRHRSPCPMEEIVSPSTSFHSVRQRVVQVCRTDRSRSHSILSAQRLSLPVRMAVKNAKRDVNHHQAAFSDPKIRQKLGNGPQQLLTMCLIGRTSFASRTRTRQ
jgi:hypothetical protein